MSFCRGFPASADMQNGTFNITIIIVKVIDSMAVTFKLDKVLQEFTNHGPELEVMGSTVDECMKDLIGKLPEIKDRLFDKNGVLRVMILLNGQVVYQKDLMRTVADGDRLQLITAISGG